MISDHFSNKGQHPDLLSPIDPLRMLWPRRKIRGVSAILLPFNEASQIDWQAFTAHVERSATSGLTPAVNMDTGYVQLLDDQTKRDVLRRTKEILGGGPFVAGAHINDRPGDRFDGVAYARQLQMIEEFGATPVIFPSHGLTGQDDPTLIAAYMKLAEYCDRYIGFELGTMFAPSGKIYSLDVFIALLGIRQCIGVKHSSLDREEEWRRLALRDRLRPDFHLYTGNDLAIDMVMYGSDYLLGLSTFAPDFFALRDRCWEKGDPAFHEINDVLQYLGFFAFRNPVPAYKHNAAMFLKLRGWIKCDATHPESPQRPDSDREILRDIGRMLGISMEN